MRASDDANEIYARAYHFDLKHERLATYRIEPLDAPPPQRLTSDAVAARLFAGSHVFVVVPESAALIGAQIACLDARLNRNQQCWPMSRHNALGGDA